MPYKTIDDLPDSVKVLPRKAQELFLEVLNESLERYNDEENAFQVAWSVVKKKWKKQGDRWVKATEELLIIEGPAFPIEKKNKNGWGIQESELENAIKSLKTAVVRVCMREDEHACDVAEDPFSEIGRVVDAWREDGYVKTRVAIADRTAKQKIEDGVWEPHWSVYGHAKKIENGWAQGVNIKSLSLVRFPAWEEAGFNIVSAQKEGVDFNITLKSPDSEVVSMEESESFEAVEWTTRYINDLPDSAFAYIEPCYKQDTENRNARHLPYKNRNGEIDLPHLRNALARVNQIKPICPDTNREEMVRQARAVLERAARQAEIGKYAASKEEGKMEKENEEKEDIVKASKEDEVYTKEQVEELIQAAVKQAKEDTIEELRQEQLAASITNKLIEHGVLKEDEIEQHTEALKAFSASQLEIIQTDIVERFTDRLTEISAARKDVNIPRDTGTDASAFLTVGRFEGGKWIGGEQ